MNSAARQWALAPSILSLIWGSIFLSVDYESATSDWWSLFVLSPERPILCSLTTTFFHANLAHVLSNIAFVYMLSFGLGELLRTRQFIAIWLIVAPLATLISFQVSPGTLVGASGGLMGVLGAALSLSLSVESKIFRKWLTVGCVAALVLVSPGDRVAHASGFVLGYALGNRIADAGPALQVSVWVTAGACGWIFMTN